MLEASHWTTKPTKDAKGSDFVFFVRFVSKSDDAAAMGLDGDADPKLPLAMPRLHPIAPPRRH
jgi:hypothetical protein